MKSVLFLGRFYTDKQLETIQADSKGNVGFSNHNFELSILSGLGQCGLDEIHCITLPQNYSFPQHHAKLFTKREEYLKFGVPVVSTSLCNLFGVNQFWGEFSMLFSILSELRKYKGDKIGVIVNTPKTPIMQALFWAKKITSKKIKTTLIVPDVPSLMAQSLGSYHGIKGWLVRKRNKKNHKLCNRFDHFVFLTEQMKELYAPKDYIVMEGIANPPERMGENTNDSGEKKSFLYSGSLHSIYGILDLIEAFNIGNFPDAELWICGSGNASEKVKAASEKNPKIMYFGLVSSAKARELQSQATVLVNPRSDEGEYTKYSFPSKTMEYLLAAKPVIMNRLSGVPEEYYNYVFTPEEKTVRGLSSVMEKVISMPREELDAKAQAGYHFVAEHKNPRVQMKRVLDMFEK